MPNQRARSVEDFRAENWQTFAEFENNFEKKFSAYARTLPARFYKSIREDLTKLFGDPAGFLTQGEVAPTFRFKVVIDTNIVIQDSLAVARGKPSTTDRILGSQFVKVLAPTSIAEECERNIRSICKRRRIPLEPALQHSRRLLARVELVDPTNEPYVQRARDLIGARSPEDISFLAVALEYQAAAVVSRDQRAFEGQAVTRRWELRNLVDSVVTFESGALSVVLVGKGASALIRALQTVVVAIASAILELLSIALQTLAALVRGAIQALSSIPAWGWLLVAVALLGVGIYAASHPEFRDRVGQGIAALAQGIRKLAEAIVQVGRALFEGFYSLLVWLWDLFLPLTTATVIVAGVLLRRMKGLAEEANRLGSSIPVA